MTTPPRFSVILITYNQRPFVGAAASSVLRSTATPLELVCVDDGSTDGTVAALEEIARADDRVRLVKLEHSGRPAVARNAGLRAARGEYVCFLDGDDLYDVRKTELLAGALDAAPDAADVVIHDYVDYYDGEDPLSRPPRIRGSAIEPRLLALATSRLPVPGAVDAYVLRSPELAALLVNDSFVVNTGTPCIRRAHIERLGVRFPEDRVVGEDNLFWLTCIVHASRTIYLDEALFFWRKRATSLSQARTARKQRELVRSLHEYHAVLVAGGVSAPAAAAARRRLLEESVEVGWLLEQEGAWAAAVRSYVRTALEFRSAAPLLRALKAVVRPFARVRRRAVH